MARVLFKYIFGLYAGFKRRHADESSTRPTAKYLSNTDLLNRARKQFGDEFFSFWLIYIGKGPRVCPRCAGENIKILHLAMPKFRIGGKVRCKWYLWCDTCLYGIYCPPGTYRIPIEEPHILYADDVALAQNLPKNLNLIRPAAG